MRSPHKVRSSPMPVSEKKEAIKSFQSRTRPHLRWVVYLVDDRRLRCTCPGFTERGMCSHIQLTIASEPRVAMALERAKV